MKIQQKPDRETKYRMKGINEIENVGTHAAIQYDSIFSIIWTYIESYDQTFIPIIYIAY